MKYDAEAAKAVHEQKLEDMRNCNYSSKAACPSWCQWKAGRCSVWEAAPTDSEIRALKEEHAALVGGHSDSVNLQQQEADKIDNCAYDTEDKCPSWCKWESGRCNVWAMPTNPASVNPEAMQNEVENCKTWKERWPSLWTEVGATCSRLEVEGGACLDARVDAFGNAETACAEDAKGICVGNPALYQNTLNSSGCISATQGKLQKIMDEWEAWNSAQNEKSAAKAGKAERLQNQIKEAESKRSNAANAQDEMRAAIAAANAQFAEQDQQKKSDVKKYNDLTDCYDNDKENCSGSCMWVSAIDSCMPRAEIETPKGAPPAGMKMPEGMKMPPAGMKMPPAGMKMPPAGMKMPPAGMKMPPAGMKMPPAGMDDHDHEGEEDEMDDHDHEGEEDEMDDHDHEDEMDEMPEGEEEEGEGPTAEDCEMECEGQEGRTNECNAACNACLGQHKTYDGFYGCMDANYWG